MGLWALWAYLCYFGALALGFVPNKNLKELRYPFDGFMGLVGLFVLFWGLDIRLCPNKIPRNCVILLIGLWAYFYLAFAFRLLWQVPLHLGFASCHDLGLGLLAFQ
jgi:hypothetical protein